jgi:hypothetical protein
MLLYEFRRQTGNDLPPSIGRNGHDLPPRGLALPAFRCGILFIATPCRPKGVLDVKLAASLAAR